MFVSILQLMGMAFGKPIQSRPGPDSPSDPDDKPSKVHNKGINRQIEIRVLTDQSQAAGTFSNKASTSSSRRQELKAQIAKPKAHAKVPAKPKAKPKAKAPIESSRKAAKPVLKAASKAATGKLAPVAKKATKAVIVKPVAKVAAAKPARGKAAGKPAAKAVKPLAKNVAKMVKPVTKVAKPASKSVKAAPAGKAVVAKKPSKVTAAPRVVTPVKTVKTVVKPLPPIPEPKVTAPVPAPIVTKLPVPVAPPAKAGRPSRLSQITVPSMAQSVASTAAKSSYTNTVSSPVLIPPAYVPVKKDPKLANNWKNKSADQLSDAEVLAMPDDEYMNDKQLAFFRLKLAQLKKDILSNAGETTEHLRADTVVVPDPADRATIEEEHALELRTRDRERKLLKKIEQSIIRIDAGDYGYCDETGEAIGVGRLLARPTATLSLEAQQRRELKQKMFGD
jgi:DnaK suppressor protein